MRITRSRTAGSIFFGIVHILPTQKDAARNLGRFTTKNNAWLKRRTAALNLRNLIGRGITHALGDWVLAT